MASNSCSGHILGNLKGLFICCRPQDNTAWITYSNAFVDARYPGDTELTGSVSSREKAPHISLRRGQVSTLWEATLVTLFTARRTGAAALDNSLIELSGQSLCQTQSMSSKLYGYREYNLTVVSFCEKGGLHLGLDLRPPSVRNIHLRSRAPG